MDLESIRAKYSSGQEINKVNGDFLSASQLSIRSVNFSQHWRTEGIHHYVYEVEIPMSFVINLLQPELEDFIRDAQEFPDPTEELSNLLSQADWQSDLKTILKSDNQSLKNSVLEFYADEVLLRWFGDGQPQETGYVLNTIESIVINTNKIIMKGECRKSHIPVKYQDV